MSIRHEDAVSWSLTSVLSTDNYGYIRDIRGGELSLPSEESPAIYYIIYYRKISIHLSSGVRHGG